MKKTKKSLPTSTSKRAAIVAAYLHCSTSPAVKSLQKFRLVASPEETKDINLTKAVMTDLRDALTEKKKKRSNEFRIEVNSIMSSVCGETVAQHKCKFKLAKSCACQLEQFQGDIDVHLNAVNPILFKRPELKIV